MSVSIVDFLNARLDELAERAKATNEADLRWLADYADDVGLRDAAAFVGAVMPPWALAEVEAKRRIITEHYITQGIDSDGRAHKVCTRCSDYADRGELHRPELAPCRTLRLLAAPHAYHPDYDPSWALSVDTEVNG